MGRFWGVRDIHDRGGWEIAGHRAREEGGEGCCLVGFAYGGRDDVWLEMHTEDGLQGRDTQDTGRKTQNDEMFAYTHDEFTRERQEVINTSTLYLTPSMHINP
ncbi:hypothetical protein SNOG_08786 [Parastagonospora nodorum SN15]|uniref:Uncharacterized protein n=1 Tax=Phaeosphaeria nodorum (strain SN15 / ATCC MYA-4574 / FGSC 10173) TaxID=321614 RepID=Q0UHH8_PHANO|nr:hypothetical protein SNOG_08786 [Parastagonospora nodorum SN15]EAT83954.2 hypothetical protein SNOG_08786 [Parastagonospora nodorum SN15]